MNTPSDLTPLVVRGLGQSTEDLAKLDFTPLRSDGRVGVEVHPLYTTEQTGSDGPAASIVRYQPGAGAATHRHTGYELIYVLEGELLTEAGVHPPNTLLMQPPGSVHTPHSETGCLLLVVWEAPVEPVEEAS
jgi:anti-sigma factor ChrR (cupin superfamily)